MPIYHTSINHPVAIEAIRHVPADIIGTISKTQREDQCSQEYTPARDSTTQTQAPSSNRPSRPLPTSLQPHLAAAHPSASA